MHPEYPIEQLCQTLSITRRCYHAWVRREPGLREQADAALLPLIEQTHRESHRTYLQSTHPSLVALTGSVLCGRRRVAKLMRMAGLSSRLRRRFRPLSLTGSDHDLPIAHNRLRELAVPMRRDAVTSGAIVILSGKLPNSSNSLRCSRTRSP